MPKKVIKLWGVQICNLCGFNEFRHTKDKKNRVRYAILASVVAVVLLMLEFYLLVSLFAYATLGLGSMIPVYCFLLTGVFTIMFTLFKASSILFHMGTYEMQITLPVTQNAIILSRFLYLYTTNLLLGLFVMLPGMLIYGIFEKPGMLRLLFFLLGTLAAPLLPTILSVFAAVLIRFISIRVKHKGIMEAALTVGILIAIFAWISNAGNGEMTEVTPEMAMADFARLSEPVLKMVENIYPPAAWFGKAVTEGQFGMLGLLFLVSLVSLLLLVAILNKCFSAICTALHTFHTKGNYQKVVGKQSTMLTALLQREFRYLLSQSLYMTNSLFGLVMMPIMAVSFSVMSEEMLGQIPFDICRSFPILLGICATAANSAACSISLEGKCRWITKTLPIPVKQQYDSKILVQLLIAVPFVISSVLILAIHWKITGLSLLWLILIPSEYLFFAANLGIFFNILFPIFDWENEARVIKQSASVSFALLCGVLAAAIPMGASILIPDGIAYTVFMAVLALVIGGAGYGLYCRNMTKEV